MDNEFPLLIVAMFVLVFAIITSNVAGRRGRDPFIWFFIGVLLGWIGLILVFLLPRVEKTEPTKEEVAPTIDLTPEEPDVRVRDWFYLDAEHEQKGPVGFAELQRLYQEHLIPKTTLVWADGMPEWQAIAATGGLLAALELSSE